MSATLRPPLTSLTVPAPRVVSVDILRGLTMAVMIFVNQLSGATGLPWWTFHAHAEEDVMTYVDMVFPFFLFVVGMSLPLSITQRLKKNPSQVALWRHIVLRFVALLALGLILANADRADAARMRMSGSLWAVLGLIAAGLYLNVYPKSERYAKYFLALRGIGLGGVLILFAIFHGITAHGHGAWIDFSYPEILGLIAYSYLATAAVYVPTRRWRWAAPVLFVVFAALNCLASARVIVWPVDLPWYEWPFNNGSMVCIILAGVVTSSIFLGKSGSPSVRRPILVASCFGMLMILAAWLLTPLGISKIRATPTWSLYSAGAAALLFTLLYWVCDVKRKSAWAFFVKPAGSNTLTTYLLPDLWDFASGVVGFTLLDRYFNNGWQAVVKTFGFTLAILAISGLLTKWKVRLQL